MKSLTVSTNHVKFLAATLATSVTLLLGILFGVTAIVLAVREPDQWALLRGTLSPMGWALVSWVALHGLVDSVTEYKERETVS